MQFHTHTNRGILRLTGPDQCTFLQGLITNDINKASADTTLYSALLTPQGKFLYDFFVFVIGGALYIECEKDRLSALQTHLNKFKLRSDVNLSDVTDQWQSISLFGENAHALFNLKLQTGQTSLFEDGIAFVDPRLKELGVMVILPRTTKIPKILTENATEVSFGLYDQHRLLLGIPDGSRDMLPDKAIPLECNLDALNAIDWNKGCYMGQELTSRTKHLGIVRKRLLPVEFDGDTLPFLTPLTFQGRKVGTMRTSVKDVGVKGAGLALIRLEILESGECPRLFTPENVEITPRLPEFLHSLLTVRTTTSVRD
ncbi:MAG: folate-binding protein [Pseudomonadota bacterium]